MSLTAAMQDEVHAQREVTREGVQERSEPLGREDELSWGMSFSGRPRIHRPSQMMAHPSGQVAIASTYRVENLGIFGGNEGLIHTTNIQQN